MKTILFVCIHNSGRSQMAESFLRAVAPHFRAESAGTLSAGTLNPMAIEAMRLAGVSMEGQYSKQLDQAMVSRADVIVSMGCGVDAEACPAKFLVTEDWGLDDPAGQSLEFVLTVRDQIQAKVADLIARMEA